MSPSRYFSGTKMARIISFFRPYTRVILFLLVFAYSVFLLIHPDEDGRFLDLFHFALLVMLIASQFFWIRRVLDLGERFIPGKPRRAWLAAIVSVAYLCFFAYNLATWDSLTWNSGRASTEL